MRGGARRRAAAHVVVADDAAQVEPAEALAHAARADVALHLELRSRSAISCAAQRLARARRCARAGSLSAGLALAERVPRPARAACAPRRAPRARPRASRTRAEQLLAREHDRAPRSRPARARVSSSSLVERARARSSSSRDRCARARSSGARGRSTCSRACASAHLALGDERRLRVDRSRQALADALLAPPRLVRRGLARLVARRRARRAPSRSACARRSAERSLELVELVRGQRLERARACCAISVFGALQVLLGVTSASSPSCASLRARSSARLTSRHLRAQRLLCASRSPDAVASSATTSSCELAHLALHARACARPTSSPAPPLTRAVGAEDGAVERDERSPSSSLRARRRAAPRRRPSTTTRRRRRRARAPRPRRREAQASRRGDPTHARLVGAPGAPRARDVRAGARR